MNIKHLRRVFKVEVSDPITRELRIAAYAVRETYRNQGFLPALGWAVALPFIGLGWLLAYALAPLAFPVVAIYYKIIHPLEYNRRADHQPEINARNRFALIREVLFKLLEVIKEELFKDVFLGAITGRARFGRAIKNGDYKVVASYLENSYANSIKRFFRINMDINRYVYDRSAEIYGYTPLGLATRCGHLEIANLLLKHGADVNALDAHHELAIMQHNSDRNKDKEHNDIKRCLLAKHLELNYADHVLFNNILSNASYYGTRFSYYGARFLVLELLRANSGVVYEKRILNDVLISVARCDVKEQSNNDRTHIEIAQIALAKGADVNCLSDGEAVIIVAAKNQNIEIVKLLLARGATVDLPIVRSRGWDDENGDTALLCAARVKDPAAAMEIVNLLLNSGADVNRANNHGKTALIAAIDNDNFPLAKLLVERGANIQHRARLYTHTNRTQTPLVHAAKRSNNIELIKLLDQPVNPELLPDIQQHNLDRNTAFTAAAESGFHDTLLYLLATGCDINCLDQEGHSALMLAAAVGRIETCKFLLNNGADVNLQNNQHKTALTYAYDHYYWHYIYGDDSYCHYVYGDDSKAHNSAIDFLIAHGADLDPQNVPDILKLAARNYNKLNEALFTATPYTVAQLNGAVQSAAYGFRGKNIGILVRHGADPDQAFRDLVEATFWAYGGSGPGYETGIKYFFDIVGKVKLDLSCITDEDPNHRRADYTRIMHVALRDASQEQFDNFFLRQFPNRKIPTAIWDIWGGNGWHGYDYYPEVAPKFARMQANDLQLYRVYRQLFRDPLEPSKFEITTFVNRKLNALRQQETSKPLAFSVAATNIAEFLDPLAIKAARVSEARTYELSKPKSQPTTMVVKP